MKDGGGEATGLPASLSGIVACSLNVNHVTGIGGFFFRARDPAALGEWYRDHLGIDLAPASYSETPWSQEAGPTVFAPFPADTDHFRAMDKQWMINFRVRDLDGLVKRLENADVAVAVDTESYPNGRFARLHDPEGNAIELWEPG